MSEEKKLNNLLIPTGSNQIIRTQHTIAITNKILKELENRLVQKDYESVKIGDQIWMKKNLNVDRFQNGDIIPEAKSFEDWQRAGKERKPVWCNYKNDPKNGEMYGKLYNWFVVNDSRGLLNKNWQVPSRELWNKLFTFLGDREHIGNKLKSENGWDENGNGTDEYSFCGLPGGFRWDYGGFLNIGSYGYWWSSTDNSIKSASAKLLSYKKNSIIEYGFPLGCGFSVRGVKIPH